MSYISKIFTPYKPRLIQEECVPGKLWVQKVNIWGKKRRIERFDAVIPPVKDNDIYDSTFVEAMNKVHIVVTSTKTKRNKKIESIVREQKPIHVTTCKIEDDAHPEYNRVIGFIKTEGQLWTYFQNISCDGSAPSFTPVDLEKIQKVAKEKALKKSS